MKVDGFLDELLSINERVSEHCNISNFIIHPSQLAQIFSSYKKNIEWIGFNYCKLETDSVVDFGDEFEGFNRKEI